MKKNLLDNLIYDYYLVKCDTSMQKTYVKNNIIYSNCDECYENLPKKLLLAYEYLYTNTDYDYFLKIDDDIVVNNDILNKYIDKKFYFFDYIGKKTGSTAFNKNWHFGKCKDKLLNKTSYTGKFIHSWCGGGFGYILSRCAIFFFLKKENYNSIYNELYEDKAFGDILAKEYINASFDILQYLKISANKNNDDKKNYIFINSH